MLIALTTGARLEEIGQLQPGDIRIEDGIVHMVIDDLDEFGEQSAAKTIKNASSRRRVPLHSDLLKLGLQDRARRLRKEGAERLFPDLPTDPFGRYTSNASRYCNRLIDKVTRDPRVVFHSLRHFFKDMCREAGMLEQVSDQLTGHAPVSIGGRYGSGVSLGELKAQLERLRFEFVDWAKIYAASRL
jgi:integrase